MALLFCPKITYSNMYQLLIWTLVLFSSYVNAFIDANGVCKVFTFVPFTTNFGFTEAIGLGDDAENGTNVGFNHMAAALLAARTFNDRNASVIPELADLDGCNITLDVTTFFDTGSLTQLASQRLAETNEIPCAVAGPFNDHPAAELSVMAQAFKYPIVVHRAFSPKIVSDFFSSYTTQLFPSLQSSTKTLVKFLLLKGRNNYVSMLYSLTSINLARRESLIFELDEENVSWMTSSYTSPFSNGDFSNDEIRSPLAALKQVKESGFRTIVVAMDKTSILPANISNTTYLGELQEIANAAEELQMNQGDYFWIWYDVFEPAIYDINENVSKIVGGSAWIIPLDRDPLVPDGEDPLGWATQGKEEVDLLNSVNPIEEGEIGYRFAEDDYFQTNLDPSYGVGYIYDAIMSIGVGACLAQRDQNNTISGTDHVDGIRNANFSGASGPVQFGSLTKNRDHEGTRLESTVSWAAVNFHPPNMDTELNVTDILLSVLSDEWLSVFPFYYRDGRTVPPDLLRDQPEQNYLTNGLRIFGLVLMSLVICLAIVSAIWVFACRKHRVVKASQPYFLYLICFGCVVQAAAVLTISFDESHEKNVDQLSAACMATPWLLTLGNTIVYTSLFTKMWRVHKVLQFRRQRTKMRNLLWPMFAILLLDIVVLTLWTVLDPLRWEREEINSVTGESIGECVADHVVAFWVAMVVLTLIPMGMTEYFAWKTKDVDEAFTESKWVFFMTLWQIEVLCVGVPILILLQEVSTDGKYIGYLFIFLTFPTSTIGFMIIPKFVAYVRDVRGVQDRPKRGERAHGRVTGISTPSHETGGTKSHTMASIEEEEKKRRQNGDASPIHVASNLDTNGEDAVGNDEQVTPETQVPPS